MYLDLYQLTMTAGEYCKGFNKKIFTSEAFVRKLSPERKFLVVAGINSIVEYLLNLRFSQDDIKQIKELFPLKEIFATTNFEKFLEDFRFTGSMKALAEGEIAFAGEPLVQITGTLPEIHFAETFILSTLNHAISIASKSARIVLASRGRSLIDFGARYIHPEASLSMSRSAYLAGFTATSNVEASCKYKIPVVNDMSHSWIMIHDDEKEAFENYGEVFRSPTLLIDTYDTIEGAKKALVSSLNGVRLDSGDLNILSKEVRKILDNNGFQRARIIASGSMNEYKIDELARAATPIDMFVVGKALTSCDSIGIVNKVVYNNTDRKPLIKLSPEKITFPGKKQIYLDQRKGGWSHLVALENVVQPNEFLTPLLDYYIKDGEMVEESFMDLEASRKYCNSGLVNLYSHLASLTHETIISPVFPDESLIKLYEEAIKLKGDKNG